MEYVAGTEKLKKVKSPTLLETSYVLAQLRLFKLEETKWLKVLKVGEYALRGPRGPQAPVQQVLFAHAEAL